LIIGTMLLVMLWLALLTQNFGLCWGKQPPLTTQIRKLLHLPARLALVEWLHKLIQESAGLPLDQPLTFEMLEKSGIHLRLVTTDLSYGRPVIMPLAQGNPYCYKPEDLKKFLPDELMTHMINESQEREDGLRMLPADQMPVVLAARLSLSFPFLLSAVRLYTDGVGGGQLHPHLMSDGGITSNFPIHFFDDWLPTHPTFGLTLLPAGQNGRQNEGERTELTRRGQAPRWVNAGGVGSFVMQMFDSARNWRDTAQAEMPTATGRICRIYLTKSEGGLNLDMASATIDVLDKRGHAAGILLREHDWRANRNHHYRALMHLLQKNFNQMRASYQDFGPQLEKGIPGYEADWCKRAHGATEALLAAAEQLDVGDGELFDTPEFLPKPIPVMRTVPDL
jgi:Patatin-like phospholipase